jgi:hypothetical protein
LSMKAMARSASNSRVIKQDLDHLKALGHHPA